MSKNWEAAAAPWTPLVYLVCVGFLAYCVWLFLDNLDLYGGSSYKLLVAVMGGILSVSYAVYWTRAIVMRR